MKEEKSKKDLKISIYVRKRIKKLTILTKWETYQTFDFVQADDDDDDDDH